MSSAAVLDRIDTLADEFWVNNPNLQTSAANPNDIEECYQQFQRQRQAEVAQLPFQTRMEIMGFYGDKRPTPVIPTLKGDKAKRRRLAYMRDKAAALLLRTARVEHLTNRRGEPILGSDGMPIPLLLTKEERRHLLLGGIIPVHAEQRQLRRDERKQLKAVRKGLFITPKGKVVSLAGHKPYCQTALGRINDQVAA